MLFLLGRFNAPKATRPDSLIAKHEEGYIVELLKLQGSIDQGHRSETYNSRMLPHCRPMVVAIGCRMAYEAAVDIVVDSDMFALFEAGVVKSNSSWYVEHLGLSRLNQFKNGM